MTQKTKKANVISLQDIKQQLWKIAETCDPQITPVKVGRMNLIRTEVKEALNLVETVMERNRPSMFKRFIRLLNGHRTTQSR